MMSFDHRNLSAAACEAKTSSASGFPDEAAANTLDRRNLLAAACEARTSSASGFPNEADADTLDRRNLSAAACEARTSSASGFPDEAAAETSCLFCFFLCRSNKDVIDFSHYLFIFMNR